MEKMKFTCFKSSIIFLVLIVVSQIFAAYDNSVVERYAGGGWGFFANNTNPGNDNLTFIAHDARIAAKDGDVISKIKMLAMRNAASASANEVKFKIFTYDGTTYTVLHDIDVTAEFNALTSTVYGPIEIEGSWTLSGATAGYGYYLGMFMAEINNSRWGGKDIGSGPTMKYVSGEITTTQLASGLSTFVDGIVLSMECYVNDNDFLAYEVTTDSENGTIGNADRITIPYWTTTPCYIIFEDVDVPDGEDLDISIETLSQSSGILLTEQTITMNYDGGGNDQLMTDDAFSTSKSITGGEGEKHRIYVWLDPVNDKIEAIFENTEDGYGPGSNDRKFISLTDRDDATMTHVGGNRVIRRIFFNQNTGTAATIGKIIVCRKPILAVGDSLVGNIDFSLLAYVGAKLDDAGVFTEQRYVINAGIPANKMREDNGGASTSLWQRWNDENNDQDLCSFKDVVVCLINGMGTNDVQAINSDATVQKQVMAGVPGGIGQIVGQAIDSDAVFGQTNDVIMCEIIPQPDGTALEQAALSRINTEMKRIAYFANVPFAVMDGYSTDYSWYNATFPEKRIHPDSTNGVPFIADLIVSAYENNLVPSAPVDCDDIGRGQF